MDGAAAPPQAEPARSRTAGFVARSGSRSSPLQVLYEDAGGLLVLMFHEGTFAQVPSLVRHGFLDANTYLLFTFSWRQPPSQLAQLRARLEEAAGAGRVDPEILRTRVKLLMNSEQELQAARQAFPGFEVRKVSNAAFLDEGLFRILPGPRPYGAVLNSKPLAFKRHHLSRLVENKIFITYDTREPDVGKTAKVAIEEFAPREVFRNRPEEEVVRLLNQSRVGLLLSEVEGACYASLEYLLCGLPVVSTRCEGGREEFYDETNAIIVEPTEEAVRDGVREALRRLREGEMKRAEIRRGTMRRVRGFRRAFAKVLQGILDAHGRQGVDAQEWLAATLAGDNKLRRHRNFWVQEVAPAASATTA